MILPSERGCLRAPPGLTAPLPGRLTVELSDGNKNLMLLLDQASSRESQSEACTQGSLAHGLALLGCMYSLVDATISLPPCSCRTSPEAPAGPGTILSCCVSRDKAAREHCAGGHARRKSRNQAANLRAVPGKLRSPRPPRLGALLEEPLPEGTPVAEGGSLPAADLEGLDLVHVAQGDAQGNERLLALEELLRVGLRLARGLVERLVGRDMRQQVSQALVLLRQEVLVGGLRRTRLQGLQAAVQARESAGPLGAGLPDARLLACQGWPAPASESKLGRSSP